MIDDYNITLITFCRWFEDGWMWGTVLSQKYCCDGSRYYFFLKKRLFFFTWLLSDDFLHSVEFFAPRLSHRTGLDAIYTIRCGIYNTRGPSQPFEFNPQHLRPFVHEDYDTKTKHNDIALFPLRQTGFPRERVGAVCISRRVARVDERAVVLGWGKTSETKGTAPSLLQPSSFVLFLSLMSWLAFNCLNVFFTSLNRFLLIFVSVSFKCFDSLVDNAYIT